MSQMLSGLYELFNSLPLIMNSQRQPGSPALFWREEWIADWSAQVNMLPIYDDER